MRAVWLVPAILLLGLATEAGTQSLTRANGHPLECASCHGDHGVLPGDTAKLLRISRTAPVAPAGLTAVSRNCLRCHYTATYRTLELSPEELVATGGASTGHYVWNGVTLANHDLGGTQYPQCATCHKVHETGLLVPDGVQQRALCTACHQDRADHPDAAHLATACSSCHAMHAADSPVAWRIAPLDPVAIARSSGPPPGARAPASVPGPLVRRVAVPPGAAPLPGVTGGAVPTGHAGPRAASQQPTEAEVRCLGCHTGNRRAKGARLPNDIRHAGRPACLQCHPDAGRNWGGGGGS